MTKRTLAAALGAGTLVLAGLATALPAASAAGNGRHAARVCHAVSTKTEATCFSKVMVNKKGAVPHSATPPPGAKTPAQLKSAYNLNGTSSGGRTVAIVDAYGYPNLASDLATYRSQFGLGSCTTASGCLKIMNQTGGTSLPRFNQGWAGEQALDVDAVSAICPDCKIVVVQAKSASIADLGTAANTAAKQAGVVAISNSYGGGDLSDATYGSYYNHPGIAVTASTGDNGYQGGSFPASSQYTTAVGGTTLVSASNSRGWTETAWSGAGSGCSTVNTALAAAAGSDTGCSKRAIADVSAAADPNNGGMAVYYPTSRVGVRAVREHRGLPERAPVLAHVEPVRRDRGQQRHLPDHPVVQLPQRLGRPDRAGHAERHGRLLGPARPQGAGPPGHPGGPVARLRALPPAAARNRSPRAAVQPVVMTRSGRTGRGVRWLLPVAGLVLVTASCGVRSATTERPHSSGTVQPSETATLVSGVVDARPGCPVERPSRLCRPRPVGHVLVEARPRSGAPASTRTRADGHYSLRLRPGRYVLVAVTGRALPRCPHLPVTVTSQRAVHANLRCDSGIR